MTEVLKNLGQRVPTASTLTDFYTVPSSTTAVVASLFICNGTGSDTTFRISIAINGAADTAAQYIYKDQTLLASDTYLCTTGITMQAGDVMRIFSPSSNIVFNLFGSEIS